MESDWLTTTLDCGDISCVFCDVTKSDRMRTSVGCTCFADLKRKKRMYVVRLFDEVKRLRERNGRHMKHYDMVGKILDPIREKRPNGEPMHSDRVELEKLVSEIK